MCPQEPPLLIGGAAPPQKREGFDKEEEKEGLRFGCRSWPAKGVQRVELVGKERASLHQLREFVCVFKGRDRAVCGR